MPTKSTGFTLVELLVALAVLVIITSVAIPNLRQLQTSNRQGARINKLSVALHVARNEALKRGQSVQICKARADDSGSLSCDADAAWNEGWIISPTADTSAKVMAFNGFSGSASLRSLNDSDSITFNRYGFSNRSDTFVLCPADGNNANARALLLERTGQVLLATDSDGNGIVEDRDGNDISCSSED